MAEPGLQHFLLKWNNHRSNMVNVFSTLLQSENLVDVTLAVEGKFLKGHKIVLSACSPYFESMFVNQTGEKHPILIFHDMKFSHLKTLLDFMYRGEISIDEKDLSDVLKVAEALSIRGLSSFESDDEDSEKSCEQDNSSQSRTTGNDSQQQQPTPTNNNSSNNSSSGNANNSNSSSSGGGGGNTGASGSGYNGYNANTDNNNKNSVSNENSNQSQSPNDNHCSGGGGLGNINCDSSVNGSLGSKSQTTKNSASVRGQKKGTFTSSSPPQLTPAKRRRGRQPLKKDAQTTSTKTYKNPPPSEKFQSTCPTVKPISNRQRVRRRIPRQFSAPQASVTPTMKNVHSSSRIKMEKGSDTEEIGGARSGTTTPDDDDMDTDFMVPDLDGASGILPADMCNSEPLSEMSVRGLDLFKYASIENNVYRCIECEKLGIPKTFKNKYSFQRHAFLYHEGNMRKVFPCPVCSREFSRPDKMKNHLRSIHKNFEEKNVRHNNGTSACDPSTDSNDKCDG